MKFLFIIQGEGRGHLTQAITMERLLQAHGHSVVSMLVGKSPARKLPSFFETAVTAPIRQFESVNFVPSSSNKRPNVLKTFFHNAAAIVKFIPSIREIRKFVKESGADAVVNFYEVLGTFGWLLSGRKIPMVCIGHQFLYLHKDFKFPVTGYAGHYGLNFFSWMSRLGATKVLALSFRQMDDDPGRRIKVVPPLLRSQIRELEPRDGDFLLGYMLNAGFAEEVIAWHNDHPEVPLHFFWDNQSKGKVFEYDETLTFYYIDDKEFLRQMAQCRGYASTAGFESICEAMYLGKPLMMVPSHIEQECNAYDATRTPAAISSDVFDLSVLLGFIRDSFVRDGSFRSWADSADSVIVTELEKSVAGYGK